MSDLHLVHTDENLAAGFGKHADQVEAHFQAILRLIGEDPERDGLLETPQRARKAWREWTRGYEMDPAEVLKSFEHPGSRSGEVVLVTDIPVYSLCEHHLAPFFGVAHIAYTPTDKIVGLSKLSRLTSIFSKRLQVQERLTNQVADALFDIVQPTGVATMVVCRHMCMESRGVETRGSQTTTTAFRGNYLDDAALRSEFYSLVNVSSAASPPHTHPRAR